jgi:hypothetical protein
MPLELRKDVQSEEEEDLERELAALSMRKILLSLQLPVAALPLSWLLAKATPPRSEPEIILEKTVPPG